MACALCRSSWLPLGGWISELVPEPPESRCSSSVSSRTFASASMMLRSTLTCGVPNQGCNDSLKCEAEGAALLKLMTCAWPRWSMGFAQHHAEQAFETRLECLDDSHAILERCDA